MPLRGRYRLFFALFAHEASTASLVDNLGIRFELLANTFKAYPCGIVIHAVIDGLPTSTALSAITP